VNAEVIDINAARSGRDEDVSARPPPHDLEAEATTLSDLLIHGTEALGRVKDFLRAEHYYLGRNSYVYASILAVAEAGSPVDVTTVGSHLRQVGRIEQVGGLAYLTEIMQGTAAVQNIVTHARIIHDRWRDRQIIATAQRIASRGYLGVEDTQAYADDAVRSLASVARMSVVKAVESNVDTIKRILAAAQARAESKTKVPLGIPTGLSAYDDEWGGLHGSEVTTVVARPGVGKTSLALQLLATIATSGIGVHMFSQDSPRDDVVTDLISHVAKVDSKRFRKGELTGPEWNRIAEAASTVGTWSFTIDDSRKIHVGQIRARALAAADDAMRKDRRPLGLVIVDYIQQLVAPPGMERARKHEYIGHAASEIKTLARNLRIPVLVLAQQKRDYQNKAVWEAADCSEIEKEADNLFFMARPSDDKRRLRCFKVRRGARREIALAFDGPSRTFSDAALEADSRRYVDKRAETPASRSAGSDDLPEPPSGFFDDMVGGGA
jgi:replicative DNA helicase